MNLPPLPPLPPGHKDIWLSDAEIRAYAEQYGRLCADAAVREERKRVSKAEREEAESSSVEAMWNELQGDDYGIY